MELWEQLFQPETWQEFLQYKIEKQHLSQAEQKELEEYMEQKEYLAVLADIEKPGSPLPLPQPAGGGL